MSKVIISPKELRASRTNKDLVIIDVRSKEAYERGHLPGAINIEAKKHFTGETSYLPELQKLGETLSEKGVDNLSNIVLYDEEKFREAAKAYFVMYYLDHSKVSILDGGLAAWKKEGYELTIEEPLVTETNYVIQPIESRAVSIDYIEEKLEDENSVLIDSRSKERYLGQKEPKYKQAGHIPNAVNYVSKDVFTKAGTWRSAEELKEHYKGLENQDEVIVSCGSGGSATLNLVGLKIAGIENVKMYAGGFSEWIEEGNEIKQSLKKSKD